MFNKTIKATVNANAIAVNTTANKRAEAFDGSTGWGIKI